MKNLLLTFQPLELTALTMIAAANFCAAYALAGIYQL